MNLLDLAATVLVLWLAVRGYRRGIILEGIEVASAAAGLFTARRTAGELGLWTTSHTGIPTDVTVPVFFCAVAVAVTALGFALAPWFHRLVHEDGRWSATDRWGGFGFGALKGVVIAMLVVGAWAQVPLPAAVRSVEGSLVGRTVVGVLPAVFAHAQQWLQSAP